MRWFESARDSNHSLMKSAALWSRTLVALNARAEFVLEVPKSTRVKLLGVPAHFNEAVPPDVPPGQCCWARGLSVRAHGISERFEAAAS